MSVPMDAPQDEVDGSKGDATAANPHFSNPASVRKALSRWFAVHRALIELLGRAIAETKCACGIRLMAVADCLAPAQIRTTRV